MKNRVCKGIAVVVVMFSLASTLSFETPVHAQSGTETVTGQSITSQGFTEITTDGGTVESADKLFAVTVPSGVIQDKASLKVTAKALADYPSDLPPHYQAVASPYLVEVQGKLQGHVNLSLLLPNSETIRVDPRKFVIFRYDEHAQSWQLLRTAFTSMGQVQIDAAQLGSYVLAFSGSPFSDLENHWARDQIEVLAAHQLLPYLKKSQFSPNGTISRAEFIEVLVHALELKKQQIESVSFNDTLAHPLQIPIEIALENGIIVGDSGLFRPDDLLTRQEMIAILMRAAKYRPHTPDPSVLNRFTDAKQISPWAQTSVQLAAELGLISGTDGRVAPLKNATRAEVVSLLYKLLERK